MTSETHDAIRVLVVDDDVTLSQALAKQLCAAGLDAMSASTFMGALDALDAASDEPIDVVVADIHLDRGNGIALARMARQKRPAVKVIHICGHEIDAHDIDVPMLKKPVSVDDLLHAIHGAVEATRRSA